MRLKIFIDGSARGNPGPGSCAAIIKDASGKTLKESGLHLGSCTNDFAEYSALMLALRESSRLGGEALQIFSDSELLVRQFNGINEIQSPELSTFMHKIRLQAKNFSEMSLAHISGEMNREADREANRVLDAALEGKKDVSDGKDGGPSQLSFY